MPNTISNYGLNLIKKFEGCRLSAYRDAVGVVTIGYGWTKSIDGKPLTMGTTITQAKAESLLKEGLKSYEAKVNKYDNKYHWNQNQFDALVSFAYNLGNIDGLTANGTRSVSQIADKFLAYNKAGGRVLPDLTSRRKAERDLFIKNSSSLATNPTLRKGDSGIYVSKLQSELTNRGYNVGKIDGKFSQKTFYGVIEFQKDNGLVTDGIVGQKTWTALS